MLGKPAPEPRQAECGAGHLIRWHGVGFGCPARSWWAARHRGGRPWRRRCRTGQAGVAQGEVARVNPGMGVCQPAGGLPIGDAGAQALDNGGGSGCRGRFQPGNGVLGFGERRSRGCVSGSPAGSPRRAGGEAGGKRVWIGAGGDHDECLIAQRLSQRDRNNYAVTFGISNKSRATDGNGMDRATRLRIIRYCVYLIYRLGCEGEVDMTALTFDPTEPVVPSAADTAAARELAPRLIGALTRPTAR